MKTIRTYRKGNTALKAAILGTEDYHDTMREIADSGLRRMMGYVPQRMKPNNPLLPAYPDFMVRADPIMQKLANDDQLANCSQRSPYLVLAWLLIGSDNEYRICRYVRAAKQVAMIHIRLALGDVPLEREISVAMWVATDVKFAKTTNLAAQLARSAIPPIAKVAFARTYPATGYDSSTEAARLAANAATAVAGTAISGVGQRAARTAISAKAHQWAHTSDEEALRIAQQLTLDILSL